MSKYSTVIQNINNLKSKSNNPKNKQTKSVKSIFLLIDTSSGEIDWILPVCHYIKINHPEVTLTVLFNHLDAEAIIRGSEFLGDLLSKCVDNWLETKDLLYPIPKKVYKYFLKVYKQFLQHKLTVFQERYIFNFIFKRLKFNPDVMAKINPDVFLKDPSRDVGVRKRIIELARKYDCKEIMFPHATSLYNAISDKKPSKSKSFHFFADEIMCNTKDMARLYSHGNKTYKNITHVVGIPRYDDWWIKYLQEQWRDKCYNEIFFKSKSTKFLLYTVRPVEKNFTEEKLNQIIHEITETVLSFPDSLLIIKPHPRYSLSQLQNILKKYDRNRWLIDQSQAMCLSSIADIPIYTGIGSAALDSSAMGKPTILYEDAELIDLPDDYVTVGISPRANDVKELENLIKKFLSDPKKERKIFLDNFNKILPKSWDNSTKKAVNVILGL